MTHALRSSLTGLFLFAVGTAPLLAQTTWYVDVSAAGPGAGTTLDPYASLQFAVDAATTVTGDTLLVATGTYLETVDMRGKDVLVDGSAASPLPVIDAGGAGSAVVMASGESPSCELRGLVLTGGTGTDQGGETFGGGATVLNSSGRFSAVRFEGNQAKFGGGLCVLGGVVSLSNCEFISNQANQGGGLFINAATVGMTDGLFEGNSVTSSGASPFGGGAYVGPNASADFSTVHFLANTSDGIGGGGGGIFTDAGSVATLAQDCAFEMNSPGTFFGAGFGGGVYARANFTARFCEFTRNGTLDPDGVFGGGGAYGGTFEDCEFVGNRAQFGAGIRSATATDCLFTENDASADGSGFGGAAAGSTLVGCKLYDNVACGQGGGAFGSTLENCEVLYNRIVGDDSLQVLGGGVYNCDVTDSSIVGNVATTFGFGFPSEGGGAANSTLTRCIVTGNTADEGGGVYGGAATLCSIVGNFGREDYGGVSRGSYQSCIVWHNFPAAVGQNPTFEYSNVEAFLPVGTGNLSIDPGLFTASGADVHLMAGSPCIDAGSPMLPLDPDGSRADMGALPFDGAWVPEPTSYCRPTLTLQGCFALTRALGPASLGGGVTLEAVGTPPQTFGLFFMGTQPNSQIVPGAGNGPPISLCVGGAIVRTPVLTSSAGAGPCDGVFTKNVTPAELSGAGGQVGGSLYGQFWFRVPGSNPTMPRSAMSDGIYLPLVP